MNRFTILAVGWSGGILALWRYVGWSLEVIPVGRQAFAALITTNNQQPWVFAGVYASTNRTERRELWVALGQLMQKGFPVCFVGDFNALTDPSEKRGGGGGSLMNRKR